MTGFTNFRKSSGIKKGIYAATYPKCEIEGQQDSRTKQGAPGSFALFAMIGAGTRGGTLL